MNASPPTLLVISPHPDDSVLGVGGLMARHAAAGGKVAVVTVAVHMPPLYPPDVSAQTIAEARQAHALLGVKESCFLSLPACGVSAMPHHELNHRLQELMERLRPQVLLVPFVDRHMDHRAVFESAMVAARPTDEAHRIALVAAYEVVSETFYNAPGIEPAFAPNWLVDISNFIEAKLAAVRCCGSQVQVFPHPRSPEAVRALALFRGSQASMAYAEALQVIRMTCAPETVC